MEQLTIKCDDARFDELLAEGLPEDGNIEIVIKERATVGDLPAAMITWSVRLPDGTVHRVQAVTTTRLLAHVGLAVAGHHQRLTGERLI